MKFERSTSPVRSDWVEKQNQRNNPLVDWEMGGAVLNTPLPDRYTHNWRLWSDGTSVFINRDDLSDTQTIFSGAGITSVSLAFDQVMRPHVAYMEQGQAKFRYWDTIDNAFKVMLLPVDAKYPRCASDDKREFFLGLDDVFVAYMKEDNLFIRFQRDRFAQEILFAPSTGKKMLVQIGMNNQNRVQFRLSKEPEL
ncbi:MAG: tail fiber protein [Podoviridae sp. ctda_1]|nr:MAG: tail fiber protein [Podoviridae sp. ctda_1]